ncbi:MAG: sugar ABC transporter permease [Defluviitaleaceae bacterium]|nr:sugar ABC transporter permease [Defluviitaleaceae bacterium]
MVTELKTLLRQNMRDYGMFIALFVIIIFFNVATNGIFMSARNVSNLINATGYIAVLAVGMTLVIVIRHIDLSVGFLAGFVGAVVALLMTEQGLSVGIAVPIALALGMAAGFVNGLFVAKVGMPAFVVSLAGMLIFRGALIQATQRTGTIMIPNQNFNAIGNGFIPDIVILQDFHFLTLILGACAIGIYIFTEFRARAAKKKYNFKVISSPIFIVKLALISAAIGYLSFVLASFNGLSWTVIIVIAVTLVYHFVTTKTVLGRHIYAIGSNPEAARLSGINVSKITLIVFGSMGFLSALSGILYTARLQSATVTAGTLFELDAIAAAYVGGVSSAGGVGKVTGSIIGALVMASLTNGMNLMGVNISYQYIVRGAVLIAAVAFDVISRNKK